MQTSDNIQTSFKPSSKPGNIVQVISYLLILLWVYAAASKLIDYDTSRAQMLNQIFSKSIANVLVWAVPFTELLAGSLLIFLKTRLAGLYASLLLLISFTIYIGLVMNNVFGRIPCSCGGVLNKMTWEQHLTFNLAFMLLTSTAILFSAHLKEGGFMGKE
ncbi:MAG: hypothetical protein Q8S11_01940 [Daejeonella sp.]|uniref:MauE/DoxX family redox-associated membrane protein n=1 Tax=Daejeonella sp. TaxID=2805397 RepID=UPI0027366700|nr:MauE/DoxX family redox-associated membrane protein [Daejeonella sp.]MDP3467064.1 hypothetical protein [Daejeonella sp.]